MRTGHERGGRDRGHGAARTVGAGGGAGSVGLLTLSHRGDLERCALLFDSIDRHVPARGTHYLVVDDADVGDFARFARADRRVVPISRFLPGWMRPIPVLRWRGRRYWSSLHGKPLSGWHIQQIVKIEAVRSLPEERVCLIDSDIHFFRDFDLTALAAPAPCPFHVVPGAVTQDSPRHRLWVATAARLLGLPEPALPAHDYIDQIIVWDRPSVQAMVARIEAVAGRGWIAALCRDRDFSEYMIYGAFVTQAPAYAARHRATAGSFTRTHWDADELDEDAILALLDSAEPDQPAFCIQSFGATPVATIRASLARYHARKATAPTGSSAIASAKTVEAAA